MGKMKNLLFNELHENKGEILQDFQNFYKWLKYEQNAHIFKYLDGRVLVSEEYKFYSNKLEETTNKIKNNNLSMWVLSLLDLEEADDPELLQNEEKIYNYINEL